MKKIIKNPILWIIIAICVILIMLYCFGFRITYNPQLDNNWNAISACAGWAGVFFSLIAILVAIRIPKVIAEQQNDITLYEKRFEVYDTICKAISFSVMIQNVTTDKEIRMFFVSSFGKDLIIDSSDEFLYQSVISLERNAIDILRRGKFLFDFDTTEPIDMLISALLDIICFHKSDDALWNSYAKYMDTIKKVKKLLPQIEESLKLVG